MLQPAAPAPPARDDDTILGYPRKRIEALAEELSALRREIRGERDASELDHLRKLERWGRWCTVLGHGTGWIAPNPLSPVLIGLGKTTRWAVIAHPISHGGYDSVPGVPERYTRRGFAKGWRRFVDWFDWIAPDAWHQEHDLMHHVRLGEDRDPDVVETNFAHVRDGDWPVPLRHLYAAVSGLTWKFAYYAPTTLVELQAARAEAAGEEPIPRTVMHRDLWNPLHPRGRELWTKCYLPYAAFHFVALPLAFLPLGPWAVFSSWANACMGEAVANLHSYLIIVPNHAGEDLLCYDEPASGKAEFYLRQILGSVNYRTGGDLNDWLHGWLNYQIEHHLFPNMSQREYQKLQPRVKALCEKYGVPYPQESVWRRAKRTLDIMVGRTSMKRWPQPA